MNQRSTILLFLLAAFLGLFFQYARLDGFLYLDTVKNIRLADALTKKAAWEDADSVTRDRYVIVYDPTDVMSMYTRHNAETMLEEQKKSFESYPFYAKEVEIPKDTRGVLLATGRLGDIVRFQDILDYVAGGGTAVLLQHPESDERLSKDVLAALGLKSIGGNVWTPGIRFLTNFVIGTQGQTFEKGEVYMTAAKALTLAEDAEVEAESALPCISGA